jgi:Tfp pilus assembly protein PilN
MKEIDFLPEWYKSSRRRQVNYRVQYIVLSGIFAVMMVWNFVATNSMSRAKAQLVQMATKQTQAEKASAKLAELKKDVSAFHKKEQLVEKIDSKINVSNILAEISFLINEKIVISKLQLISEKFLDEQNDGQSMQNNTALRSANYNFAENIEHPLGNMRFKVLITGVAANASEVATLICNLEESPYFFQVTPSYTRSAQIEAIKHTLVNSQRELSRDLLKNKGKNLGSEDKITVSEFEISCYLANYL